MIFVRLVLCVVFCCLLVSVCFVRFDVVDAVSINDPSGWRFLAGYDMAVSIADQADYVYDSGANGVYYSSFIDTWYGSGRTCDMSYAQEVHSLGMLVEWLPVYWSVMQSNSWDAFFQSVLHNTDGARTLWISRMVSAVDDIEPDIVSLFNEPVGELGDGSTAYLSEYVALCNAEMFALNAVKSNLVFVVNSVPFWDLSEIASLGFSVPSGCTLLYSFHYYYSYVGEYPSDYVQQMYWDGYGYVVKDDLYSQFLYDMGVQSVWDEGKTVIFDEFGTNINNPYFDEFLNDAYSFCVDSDVGFCALNNILPDEAAQKLAGQIFNDEDWSFNDIGDVWSLYLSGVPEATPTPTASPVASSGVYGVSGVGIGGGVAVVALLTTVTSFMAVVAKFGRV